MNSNINRPLALIILDGWGFSANSEGNAIAQARTPFYDEICYRYPSTLLTASGEMAGLPDGAPGNAEVGHVNIGAGRIVRSEASRIGDAIRSGAFFENSVLKSAFEKAAATGHPVHLVGLLSDGDVHSSSESLFALLRLAKKNGISDVFVHGILDGRDVPSRTADDLIKALEMTMADIGVGTIASLCGRFFAMDSGENWERTARAFTMLVHAEGERVGDPITAIRNSFLRGISEEFIAPIVIERAPGIPVAKIASGDLVVFFNHRSDTMRQLVRSLAVPDPGEIAAAAKPAVDAVCLTEYDKSFALPVAFRPAATENSLAAIFADRKINNYRISETDRIAHVTNFFNGDHSSGRQNEVLIHIAGGGSAADRETRPEMRSFKITDALLRTMKENSSGVFVVNIPAPGLVAQSGDLDCTIEAVQFVDTCLGGVLKNIRETGAIGLLTSTHGNCEEMIRPAGESSSFPTTNPVPFHLIDEQGSSPSLRPEGSLQDVAPTILGLLGIEKPSEMSGRDLRFF
jgi:2,3-bisphosphoglycerate-independent phosphoglycerate mutase